MSFQKTINFYYPSFSSGNHRDQCIQGVNPTKCSVLPEINYTKKGDGYLASGAAQPVNNDFKNV